MMSNEIVCAGCGREFFSEESPNVYSKRKGVWRCSECLAKRKKQGRSDVER